MMAQSKKRITVGKRKSTGRGGAHKSSRSAPGKATKKIATKLRPKKGAAKAKRPRAQKVARKKAKPMKQPITAVAETTIVDVVEPEES
jgi:hypothetical protein